MRGWLASFGSGVAYLRTLLCEASVHESVTGRSVDLVARWLGLSQTRADFVKTLLSECAFALKPKKSEGEASISDSDTRFGFGSD